MVCGASFLQATGSRWRGLCPRSRTASPSRPREPAPPSPPSSCRYRGWAGGLEGLRLPSLILTPSLLSSPHQVMQAQFAQDNNPDAQTLQKLADMTGLSRRVIQVRGSGIGQGEALSAEEWAEEEPQKAGARRDSCPAASHSRTSTPALAVSSSFTLLHQCVAFTGSCSNASTVLSLSHLWVFYLFFSLMMQ